MMQLWLGLGALTLFALGFVVFPLWRMSRAVKADSAQAVASDDERNTQNIAIFKERRQELEAELKQGSLSNEQFERLELELKQSLLEDVNKAQSSAFSLRLGRGEYLSIAILACALTVLSIGLYNQYGSARILQQIAEAPRSDKTAPPSLEEAVTMLEQELDQRPDNPEGWYLLATTYTNMGEFDKGVKSFKQLLQYLPPEAPQYAGVMGQYAQALFFAKGGKMDAEVQAQIERTLDIEPREVTVLGLLGIDAFETKEYAKAIAYWRKALENAEPSAAESLKTGLRRAVAELEKAGEQVPDIPELADNRLSSIRLQIGLGPDVQSTLPETASVFIFARPVGQRMPVAAVRLVLADLPAHVVLDDTRSMRPEARLSMESVVEVGARVSLSGQPGATAGDIESRVVRVDYDTAREEVTLILDQLVK